MRPVRLEFCGVNSFSEVQKIDFEELLQYGLFGIFGDTGSGKSTILDCIGFALYGEVTRSRSGKIADIINYEKDKAYVHFEFETDYAGARRRYRVERELKRKNAAQSLKVYEFDREQGVYLCIADAVRQGNELLEKIIGLEQKDYEKCIALPQGEFAQFVKAARSDRLKLVSRLFDLERYGERLVTRANAAFREAATAVELSKARLLPYESYTKEGVEQIKKEIKTLSCEAEAFKKKLSELKKREKAASAMLEKSKEAKAFYEKFEKLKEELPRTERIEKELELLASATAAGRADEELAVAKGEARKAAEALRSAQERLLSARRAEESAKSFDGEKAEAEIALLTAQRALAQEREKQESRLKELKEKLFASRQTYKELKSGFAEFDYEKEKQKIEERIASCAKADGLEKAAFFRGEYLTFKNELEGVEKKFPQTQEEIEPLIQKYAALSTGEEQDFSLWERHNAEREKQLNAANEALFSLEQKYGDYKAHLIKLKSVEEEGQRIKQEIEELNQSLDAGLSVAETERRLARLKAEIKEQAEIKERAAKALSSAEAEVAAATEREKADKKALAEAEKRLSDALKAGGFSEIASARALCERYGDGVIARERAAKFREEYASAKAG